jgi:hypothetical protein
VGPMQFIPSTWRRLGRDGNHDGVADPNNLFDAATSAAAYLCLAGGDLTDRDGLRRAVYAYNHSWRYVDAVLGWASTYQGGVTVGPAVATARAATGPQTTTPPPTTTRPPATTTTTTAPPTSTTAAPTTTEPPTTTTLPPTTTEPPTTSTSEPPPTTSEPPTTTTTPPTTSTTPPTTSTTPPP